MFSETSFRHALRALTWSEDCDDATVDAALELRLRREWETFCDAAETLGFDPERDRATMIDPAEGDEVAYAAHDWVLTRNRHGAGFWEGNWQEPWGDQLTALCHLQGEIETYVEGGVLYGA